MKNYNIILPIILAAGTLFSSCHKYLDINADPNSASQPPIKGLLANTTYSTATNLFNISDFTSYFVQYLASPNASSAQDIYETMSCATAWDGVYNIMTDIHDMRALGFAKGYNSYVGIADILMALHINMASNLWGDMPYTEAFKGGTINSPAYDNQEILFDSCLTMLTNGINYLKSASSGEISSSASDFIHGGSYSAWIMTAHALKARLYTQLSKTTRFTSNKLYDSVLLELDSAYTSNSNDAQVTSFAVRNPWATVALDNAELDLDGWLSTQFVKSMNDSIYSYFDPRLPRITDKTKYGDYRGTKNGAGRVGTGTDSEECYLMEDKYYSSDNAPIEIVTYKECMFMKAEAYLRQGNSLKADSAYVEGIRANMTKMGVATDSMYTYINTVNSVGSTGLTLNMILREKYLALFLSPVTWDDMRRMNYSTDCYKGLTTPTSDALGSGVFIRRMNYPSDETSLNSKNVPSITGLDERLWWDK